MADVATTTASDTQSYEALRRVKATETDWTERLAGARQQLDATLARLRDESDAAVKAAQAEADGERAAAVQKARDAVEREAAVLLEEGEAAAAAVSAGEGKRPADRRDAILGAVLGDFAGD